MGKFKFQSTSDVSANTTNLDRLASTILALVYSYEHLEYGFSREQRAVDLFEMYNNGGKNKEVLNIIAETYFKEKSMHSNKNKTIKFLKDLQIILDNYGKGEDKLTNFIGTMMKSDTQDLLRRKNMKNTGRPDIGVRSVKRSAFNKKEPTGSEIHFDTVAVCEYKKKLYVSMNYKNRVLQNKIGLPENNVLKAVVTELKNIFKTDKIKCYESIIFIKPNLEKIKEITKTMKLGERVQSDSHNDRCAAPHAEMQLLSAVGGIQRVTVIGVSKPPCECCKTILKKRKINYTEWEDSLNDDNIKNWLKPESIEIVEVEIRMFNLAIV